MHTIFQMNFDRTPPKMIMLQFSLYRNVTVYGNQSTKMREKPMHLING